MNDAFKNLAFDQNKNSQSFYQLGNIFRDFLKKNIKAALKKQL